MDKNAGKYHLIYQSEFDLALKILSPENGLLEWSKHDYEAFTFKNDRASLIFYPHRTSAMNYHIRVRDSGSKDKAYANDLMEKLDRDTGFNCTFTRKNEYKYKKREANQ